MVACGRHGLLVVNPFNQRQGHTDFLELCFRRSSQAGCPRLFSLHCHDTGQPLQAGGKQFLVAYLLRHRQAFFWEMLLLLLSSLHPTEVSSMDSGSVQADLFLPGIAMDFMHVCHALDDGFLDPFVHFIFIW
jgi:hypothetical protein